MQQRQTDKETKKSFSTRIHTEFNPLHIYLGTQHLNFPLKIGVSKDRKDCQDEDEQNVYPMDYLRILHIRNGNIHIQIPFPFYEACIIFHRFIQLDIS